VKTHDETRWYRVQMDYGPYSTGANEYDLLQYVRECSLAGIDFTVTWYDTSDEAYAGCSNECWSLIPRTQDEVNAILRTRQAARAGSGDVAVRLSHVEFDEKIPECNPGASD